MLIVVAATIVCGLALWTVVTMLKTMADAMKKEEERSGL